jgi:hypothetical protein
MLKEYGCFRVYIAGPYTKGDVCVNVRNAVHAADAVHALGHAPFVPHLTHLWHMVSPKDYQEWLALDIVWLSRCDCLVRIEGESNGADLEVKEAMRLGIPVYYGVAEFAKAAEATQRAS